MCFESSIWTWSGNIFRYKEYINWLQIDEILTYVFMFGGPSISFFAVRAPKKTMWLFLTRFLAWQRVFAIFPTPGGLLVCENEKLNCFDIQCVVEASSFRLNHNMATRKQRNYSRHTKTVQNALGFMPEVKPLINRVVIWCCAPVTRYRNQYWVPHRWYSFKEPALLARALQVLKTCLISIHKSVWTRQGKAFKYE